MFHGLFTLMFGEGMDYLTRNQGEIKRKAIGNGALVCGVIWLLCLFGEVLIPPLQVVRMHFQEVHWIAGKLVLGLLALPVGFPIAYTLTRRHLERQVDKLAAPEPDPAAKAAKKAREIQRLYEVILGVGLWAWFWFLTPVQAWMERSHEDLLAQTMALLLLWFALAALLGIVGGHIIYTCAVKRLRRKGQT